MIKAIIVDDEPLARSVLKEHLESVSSLQIIAECSDGFEGVKAIQEMKPDLLFLDIQMPKINGFEMLELIDHPPAVIFTTAYDEFALRAFEANAVDYLLKPFSKERLYSALKKFFDQQDLLSREPSSVNYRSSEKILASAAHSPPQNQRIVVKTGSKIKIIPIAEVQYFEAADDYVKIVTADGNFLKNKTMNFFEEILEPHQYVRTHRSFIVNVQHITRIDAYEKESHVAILKSGKQIPVSKSGYGKLKAVLGI